MVGYCSVLGLVSRFPCVQRNQEFLHTCRWRPLAPATTVLLGVEALQWRGSPVPQLLAPRTRDAPPMSRHGRRPAVAASAPAVRPWAPRPVGVVMGCYVFREARPVDRRRDRPHGFVGQPTAGRCPPPPSRSPRSLISPARRSRWA